MDNFPFKHLFIKTGTKNKTKIGLIMEQKLEQTMEQLWNTFLECNKKMEQLQNFCSKNVPRNVPIKNT